MVHDSNNSVVRRLAYRATSCLRTHPARPFFPGEGLADWNARVDGGPPRPEESLAQASIADRESSALACTKPCVTDRCIPVVLASFARLVWCDRFCDSECRRRYPHFAHKIIQ